MFKKKLLALGALIAIVGVFIFTQSDRDQPIRDRVVKISSHRGMCSGEQVRAASGVDYILTAAHCIHLQDENGYMSVTTEDGRQLKRKVIAEDPKSDLLLLEGLPNMVGLSVASSDYFGQEVRTFTHGSNLDTYKTKGVLVQDVAVTIALEAITSSAQEAYCNSMPGKLQIFPTPFGRFCVMAVTETVTTAKIVAGSSGGMVVDSRGDLVGVVSAGNGDFGALVKLSDIQEFLHNY